MSGGLEQRMDRLLISLVIGLDGPGLELHTYSDRRLVKQGKIGLGRSHLSNSALSSSINAAFEFGVAPEGAENEDLCGGWSEDNG